MRVLFLWNPYGTPDLKWPDFYGFFKVGRAMPRKSLTTRFIESIEVDNRTDYWDEMLRGLVLRVTPQGAKTWNVVYTRELDGVKVRHTIGRFPALSLEKARAKALTDLAAIAHGGDPAGEKKARRDGLTIEQLGDLFIEKYSKPRKRSWQTDQRILRVDVYPKIGRLKAG
jgi:Arm DNA-binding domain